jgi:hypothetical protein
MHRYYAMCPVTKQTIETGFESDEMPMFSAMNDFVDIFCPVCGVRHPLRVSELFPQGGRGLH